MKAGRETAAPALAQTPLSGRPEDAAGRDLKPGPELPLSFTDDLGYPVRITSCQRVVSLYGSFAEAWLLAGGTLVGTTEDALSERRLDLGPETAGVGQIQLPNLEKLLLLAPDLVILSAEIPAQVNLHPNLQAAGIAHAYFTGATFSDYLAMLEKFCRLTGRPDLYRQKGLQVQQQIQAVKEQVRAGRKNPPRVLLLRTYAHGLKVKNSQSMAGAMLKDLGAVNIADGRSSLLEDLSLEKIVAEDPELILVVPMGEVSLARQWLQQEFQANAAWSSLTAVQNKHLYLLPKELFHYKPNARWGESYAYLAGLLQEGSRVNPALP